MFAYEATGLSLVSLVVTVWGFIHDANEFTGVIGFQQWIPFTTPQDFDYIPTGTTEGSFKRLDDLAVTSDRPVETLQITVNSESEVIQFVVSSNVQRTAGCGLIQLTVTQECPNVLV